MTVGILHISLFIPESDSLKSKRMVMHSIKARLRTQFNVAVAQLEDGDKWQKAALAVVGVEKSRDHMNSVLSEIVNFVERYYSVHLIDYEMEFL
ncbi:MAG TPA: DUF503 domain-containing protein [Candidatus Omnitrophota bacterium]|nr:DUF503 domain-containing protein [Candidatus Omnitrophota bacterium]HRZ14385.1 DUF503 domain-containing protein [Candidatus Omnitrophota bacterium]